MTERETTKITVTDNYIGVEHEYFGPPDDADVRLRSRDIWYASRPSQPRYGLVDLSDEPIPGHQTSARTAWSIGKAGLESPYIFDRDDINGLRKLLDQIEQKMDADDMTALTEDFHEPLDTDEEEK